MRAFRFRGFTRCILFCGIATIATLARANSGTQMPISQIQAGTEHTTPVQNSGFESVTSGVPNSWLQDGNMQVGAPINPAPNNLDGSEAAQALTNQLTSTDPENYHYSTDNTNRTVLTFDQNTSYVLSGYVWNFARPDSNPNDTPDLALVELDDINNPTSNKNIALARIAGDNGDGANGYFISQQFDGSFFPNGAYLDVRGDLEDTDPNPLNPPNNIYAQFDNIAITPEADFVPPTPTPEPASLAFLGIAAVLGLRRRK